MSENILKEIKEKEEVKPEGTSNGEKPAYVKAADFTFYLDRETVAKVLPFTLFLAFLALVYISNSHYLKLDMHCVIYIVLFPGQKNCHLIQFDSLHTKCRDIHQKLA